MPPDRFLISINYHYHYQIAQMTPEKAPAQVDSIILFNFSGNALLPGPRFREATHEEQYNQANRICARRLRPQAQATHGRSPSLGLPNHPWHPSYTAWSTWRWWAHSGARIRPPSVGQIIRFQGPLGPRWMSCTHLIRALQPCEKHTSCPHQHD